MALWKISAKNDYNWGPGKILSKGMFIEMSTQSTTPPTNISRETENIIRAFNNKYSTRLDPTNNGDKARMNAGHLSCERIG